MAPDEINSAQETPVSQLPVQAEVGTPVDDEDFLAGSQACNLDVGTCEACQ